MSETVISGAEQGAEQDFLTDGEMPRLGAAPPHPMMIAAQPVAPPSDARYAPPATALVETQLLSPGGLPSPQIDAVPVLTSLTGPSLPIPVPLTEEPKATPTDVNMHPMAHLMPTKSVPTEASKRAAEARAAKKAKARRIKIGITIGVLAVGAVVGPPLGRWFVNALNEENTKKAPAEQPTEAPADPVAELPAG